MKAGAFWGERGGDGKFVVAVREKIGGWGWWKDDEEKRGLLWKVRGDKGDEREGANWRPCDDVRREGVWQGVGGGGETW